MPNTSPVSSNGILDNPILVPVKITLSPLLWVIQKVCLVVLHPLTKFVGYFVWTGVFSYGAWQKSWVSRQVIELYSGRLCTFKKVAVFDKEREKKAIDALEAIGGEQQKILSKDGTPLNMMHIRYQDVKSLIETKGGEIIDCLPIDQIEETIENKTSHFKCVENQQAPKEYKDVILINDSDQDDPNSLDKILSRLGLNTIEVKRANGKTAKGYVTMDWGAKIPPYRPKQGQLFLRNCTPVESYAMSKRDIMRRFLGTKNDVLLYDYRGTGKSKGIPTEGGYYLDGETVLDIALKRGYPEEDIWIDGFCEGGAVGIHQLTKHPKINVFMQHAFDNMVNVLNMQVWPASVLAKYGIEEIKSKDPRICNKVEQDGFDNIKKLENLRKQGIKGGTALIFTTDTDRTIDPNSPWRLVDSCSTVFQYTFFVCYSPTKDRDKNGHRIDPFSADRNNWLKCVTFITAKDYPEILS